MISAANEFWGLTCWLPEPKRSGALLMTLKAYIDESGAGQPPALVMAGWVASASEWARFAEEWDRFLDTYRLSFFTWMTL